MATLTDSLEAMLGPTVESMGYQLWGVEFVSKGKDSTLRLYIDSPNGIDVDDCAAVSRQVSGILDVEDPIPSEYNLEVSSPGMDRPLFTEEQYGLYIGCIVKLKLQSPVEGRRNFKGRLIEVVDGAVTLDVADMPAKDREARKENERGDGDKKDGVVIGLWQIARGQVIPEFG